jgi:hypothetical protein
MKTTPDYAWLWNHSWIRLRLVSPPASTLSSKIAACRLLAKMYGPPPNCKRFEVRREDSPRKCIRPLSGEWLSGHYRGWLASCWFSAVLEVAIQSKASWRSQGLRQGDSGTDLSHGG